MLELLLLAQGALAPAGARALAPLPPKPPQPPNILIVVVDDLGVDQIGCYAVNYPALELQPCTPNIDALAASSLRFTNAWSNPLCSPARATLQTGRPAHHTGVGTMVGLTPELTNSGLQLDEPTLPKLLGGYASAALGKWHLSDIFFDNCAIQHPIALGYQEYAGSMYVLETSYIDWTKTLFPAGLQFQHYNVYATADTTDDALLRMASLPEPWLLYVACNAAHSPLHCPVDLGDPCQPIPSGTCGTNWCSDCGQLLVSPAYGAYPPEVVQARAVAQALDRELGRLLAAVDTSDTALILTADNGSEVGTLVPPFHDERSKGTVYQGGVNVPFLLSVPGGLSGECHELVQMTDLYATVADLAGIELPPDPLRDSVSLLQYVAPTRAAPGTSPRTHAFTEFFSPNFVPQAGGTPPAGYEARMHHRALRNATHKLIEKRWWDPALATCLTSLEFYELAAEPPQDPAFGPDPHEQHDLMQDPASWSPATTAAFVELNELLLLDYPQLPVLGHP